MMEKNDFLQPLLDMMNDRMNGLDKKIDANTVTTNQVLEQVSGIAEEVVSHDKAIKRLETVKGRKPLTLNPNTVYLIALGFVLLMVIIAAALHINLGGLVK